MGQIDSNGTSQGRDWLGILRVALPSLVALFAIVLFRSEISRSIEPGEGKKVAIKGMGLSFESGTESFAAITKEIVVAGMRQGQSAEQIGASVERVGAALRQRSASVTPAGGVLWVDDNPDNNVELVEAIRAAGVRIDTATSNKSALKAIAARTYSAVVTDLGRDAESEDGFNLVQRLRAQGNNVPILVYTSYEASEGTRNDLRLASATVTADPAIAFEGILAWAGKPR